MATFDPVRHKAATAIFKLGTKASSSGIHRTVSEAPKGKGWVQCINAPQGMMCKPEKVKESIEYFKIAYEVFPEIVALNQIALAYEMLGEAEKAREYYARMKAQAESEANEAYLTTAEQGIVRTS
jgi:tetratricopeptide (TPR) repeat protein